HRESRQAIDGMLGVLRAEIAYLRAFHTHLILYVQQITAYVDTKDRDTAGRALVVNAAVNALAEDVAKRWESMAAREQRFDARVSGLTAAHDEVRTLIGVVQQATLTMKRELQRVIESPAGATVRSGVPRASDQADSGTPDMKVGLSGLLDSYKYVGFEDQFRG